MDPYFALHWWEQVGPVGKTGKYRLVDNACSDGSKVPVIPRTANTFTEGPSEEDAGICGGQ